MVSIQSCIHPTTQKERGQVAVLTNRKLVTRNMPGVELFLGHIGIRVPRLRWANGTSEQDSGDACLFVNSIAMITGTF
jgi:hypothetical protein